MTRRRGPWLIAVAASLALIAGCSTAASDDAVTTTVTPTSVTTATVIGTPVPPLPADVNPVPYGIGQIAALGNLQVTLDRVEPVTDGRVTITVTVRNGSLDELVLDESAFRLYASDGSSVLMTDVDEASVLGTPIASGATVSGGLTADLAPDLDPAMVLVSQDDDRVLPGSFVLGEFTVHSEDS